LFEQGDIGFQIERHVPWLPKENVRHSFAWIKGAAGPAATQQVNKFTNAIIEEMRRHGVAGQKLGVDFIDINMINIFKENNINWVDGMTPMMEARAVKSPDEQECFRIVGAIGDATHWECMKFLRPGITENQVTAHLMKYLYNIPGMEDVEDVIVSSGPNTWPNWRNFSDRIIQPGDIVFMDLAALTWNGYKSCYYRTYCAGKEPTGEQKDIYATAGIRTTSHSKICENLVPTEDATTVAKLYQAGGVLLGKLATHEFAHGGPSFDLPWPPARNPWNRDHFTGGSSSGAGVNPVWAAAGGGSGITQIGGQHSHGRGTGRSAEGCLGSR